MSPYSISIVLAGVSFLVIVALVEVGFRLGARDRRRSEGAAEGVGAIEAAVIGLVGLIFAFTFGSASHRLENRRELIVREANAIGTAYLRLDLLPAAEQPALRKLFRQYLETRLRVFLSLPDKAAVARELEASSALQRQIWERSLAAARASGDTPTVQLLVPALNEMIDVTTNRAVAVATHLPAVVVVLLACLGSCAALLSGYAMSKRPAHSPLHMLVFAVAIATTIYVVLDLEFPRFGLIRVDAADSALTDLRGLMQK